MNAHPILAPFAEVETGVNDAVISTLANAVAVFAGGAPFAVIFDRAAHDSLDVIADYAPTCSLPFAKVPGVEPGSVLHINGAAFEVTRPAEPDSSGWVTLELRERHG